MKSSQLLRGAGMLSFVLSLITLAAGVALMYVLPEYIVSILNQTGLFTAATVATAITQVGTVRTIGFLVIIISLIWMVISVISMRKG